MMRAFNYIFIVVVLVVSAMLGRGYWGGSPLPAFQADLTRCLNTFWQTQGSQVEVLGDAGRAEVRASVAFPPGTGPRQQQWMNEFIPFVATRHPKVKVGSVRVVPLAGEAKKEQAAAARPMDYQDATRAEVLQTTLQARLTAELGPGMALVLVDVGSAPVALSGYAVDPTEPAPEKQRVAEDRVVESRFGPWGAVAPEGKSLTGGAPARRRNPDNSVPGAACKVAVPPSPEPPLLGCLVVQSEAAGKQAGDIVRPSLGQLRLVVLPDGAWR